MKTKIAILLLVGMGVCCAAARAQDSSAQDANAPKADSTAAPQASAEVLPMVQFEDAPLVDVIKTLGRQAGINLLFDPRVLEAGPNNTPKYPPVSIRLENVTAQNVLEAILNNNNLRLERDPKTLISRVTIKDPAAAEPLDTRVFQLKYTNPSNLVTIVKPMFGSNRSQAIPDGRTSQLIVIATEKELLAVDKLVSKLDTVTKQVLIEARILETVRNPETVKGINWAGTLQAQNFAFGNNAYGGATGGSGTGGSSSSQDKSANSLVQPLTTPGMLAFMRGGYIGPVAYLNADGARAVLSFFNKDSESEVLATPRAVTTDNTPAMLSVSSAVPIFRVTQGGTQTGNSVDITYTNLGVILEVTPRVSANNQIALKLTPEVSDIEGKDEQTFDGQPYTANIFGIRRITTQVLIPSGNTLVLGGLLADNKRKDTTKVPVLGDLPGMKYIFGSTTKTHKKRNLLIFVTPTVVADTDFQPASSDFLKTPMPAQPAGGDMGSFEQPWDGTKQYDWNKPVY